MTSFAVVIAVYFETAVRGKNLPFATLYKLLFPLSLLFFPKINQKEEWVNKRFEVNFGLFIISLCFTIWNELDDRFVFYLLFSFFLFTSIMPQFSFSYNIIVYFILLFRINGLCCSRNERVNLPSIPPPVGRKSSFYLYLLVICAGAEKKTEWEKEKERNRQHQTKWPRPDQHWFTLLFCERGG